MPYSQAAQPDMVFTVDLTAANVFRVLVPPGTPIAQVYVSTLPAGADFRLRFGQNNQPVPMAQQVQRSFFVPLEDGLVVESNAQPGLTAVVVVVVARKRGVYT